MRRVFFCLLLASVFSAANAQGDPVARLVERFPKGSITSLESASLALDEVEKTRSIVDAQYVREEKACSSKFFVTACVDTAKETRRQSLAAIKSIDLEASAFMRKARVEERDQAVKQKQSEAVEMESNDREQAHQEKLRQRQEEDARQEAQRQENIAAYQKKQQDALKRQKDMEKRKAEKRKTPA